MKEFKDEQQDDQRDTDVQDVENKKDAYLKKKRKEEENKEVADRLERIANLEKSVANLQQNIDLGM